MTMDRRFADTLLPALLRARTERRLSRQEVARLLGVTYGSLGSWERGDRLPSAAETRAWADALGVAWPNGADEWFVRKSAGVQPCGTRAAFLRHRYHGEKPCEEDHVAANTYHRNWMRTNRQSAS